MYIVNLMAFALISITSVVCVLLWIKSPPRLDVRLASLNEDLEAARRAIAELTMQARDSKDTAMRVASEVAATQGRLANLSDLQQRLVNATSSLEPTLSLRLSEGVLNLSEELRGGMSKLAHELAERDERTVRTVSSQIDGGFTGLATADSRFRVEVAAMLSTGNEVLCNRLAELGESTEGKLREINTSAASAAASLNETAQRSITTVTDRLADLKTTVDAALKAELGAIRDESSNKLEAIRQTVDDKLHATLEQRLGESFKLVSDRLEVVHRGLGEMQALASGVGDLKKVLTNVKTRGLWGEIQLESLLEQILSPEQYGKNVNTIPGSANRVEFAIRLPGQSEEAPLWLPIDSKFPLEDYQRLIDAQERADASAVHEAMKGLEARIRTEARAIREKYVSPPYTTDFAVLYLATEGLYAEVLRCTGLVEWIQRECKVTIAGPTTISALLNSLQLGFRTLAIEKRSAEVWTVLATVKSEFSKFGAALAHTKKKLQEAHNSIESTERRNRVLTRKLKEVDGLPLQPDQSETNETMPMGTLLEQHSELTVSSSSLTS